MNFLGSVRAKRLTCKAYGNLAYGELEDLCFQRQGPSSHTSRRVPSTAMIERVRSL